MTEWLVPRPARKWLRTRIREAAFGGSMPVTVMKYIPEAAQSRSYVIPKEPGYWQKVGKDGLPIPPRELWLGYGGSVGEYLSSGQRHVGSMLDIVSASGFTLDKCARILEFGCGSGRMIRCLRNLSVACEIWGADINAQYVNWCKQYLEPTFHFVTTTTIPHLPFEDGYFEFIFAGSVFTHIDDLADAWLLELRRVLSHGGRLYLTIHDNHTMELLDTEYMHTWLSRAMNSKSIYRTARGYFGKMVLGRDADSQVFYDIDYFRNKLEVMYSIISITREAYDYQTAVLVKPTRFCSPIESSV